MRQILLELLLSIVCSFSAFAQGNDPWIGTWTSESYSDTDWDNSPKDSEGTYTEIVKSDYKVVIRIAKVNDNYVVRRKTIKVKDPEDVSYALPMVIKRIAGNTMYVESYKEKMPFYSDGVLEEYSDITYFYILTLENGMLHYQHTKFVSVNYYPNKRYKDTETYYCGNGRGDDLHLFNDDW